MSEAITDAQLDTLNGMLGLLGGRYAAFREKDPDAGVTVHDRGLSATGHPDAWLPTGYGIYPLDRTPPTWDDLDRWQVSVWVQDGGSREEPPTTDEAPISAHERWHEAVRALVCAMLADAIDAQLVAEGEAAFAAEEAAAGTYDVTEPGAAIEGA